MRATELIGKEVIRTAPTSHGDYSFTSNPIIIINATDEHIIYKYPSDNCLGYFDSREKILNFTWCDDNWIDYEELTDKKRNKPIKIIISKTNGDKDCFEDIKECHIIFNNGKEIRFVEGSIKTLFINEANISLLILKK